MSKPMPEFMLTPPDIAQQLREIEWKPGMTVLVHSSLRQIGGWIPGGTEGVITAMLDVLGDGGTLVMPTFTTDNSEPSYWENPPIPESWWQVMRDTTPPFNVQATPTCLMGVLAENFRSWPSVVRSNHPQGSFAARGQHAVSITTGHDLEQQFGDKSPLGRIYDLDGYVFLLGVGHGNNTSLHLAEERMLNPKRSPQGSAVTIDDIRQWVTFETVDYDADDFVQLGAAYEAAYPDAVRIGTLGKATVRLMRQRPLVDFALDWLNTHRRAIT